MILISTTHQPATELGFLLHKNPDRVHEACLPFGKVTVMFPEASPQRCTAAVITELNTVELVRSHGRLMDDYVNDRPYVTSSFDSSALAKVFGTAASGLCKERPELANTPIPLEIEIPTLPCRGGESFLKSVFEPLGYQVEAVHLPLDKNFPEWGSGRLFHVKLSITATIREVLQHLRVLIPVLDNEKHYWVQSAEVDKLLRLAKEWLTAHPLKEEITRRYMLRQPTLTREALKQLLEHDGTVDSDEASDQAERPEQAIERALSLHEIRLKQVHETIRKLGARRVIDLGCGEGKLIKLLAKDKSITEITGVDVSIRSLERASARLKIDSSTDRSVTKVKLFHGSLMYRDSRFQDFDLAALVEVIEHLDPPRLSAMERVVFEFARPQHVVITTPNREYNSLFDGLAPGAFRHGDHRFEWTRGEFAEWAGRMSERFGYSHVIEPLGPEDATHGAPSQMAIFARGGLS